MKSIIVALGLIAASAGYAFEALPEKPPIPKDNPMSPAKIELGKKLYLDPRLSVDGTISCNSCHNIMGGGDDDRPVSAGVRGQLGTRSAPTVWNAAFLSVQFWDGRAKSLEEQAKGPMVNPIEMGNPNHDFVVSRLKKIPGYQMEFKVVFGDKDALNIDNVAKAIAAFERTLITPNSRFDRYLKGDKNALGEQEIRGMQTFEKTGCVSCHSGPNFAGPMLPEGQGFYQKFPTYPGSVYDKKYNLTEDPGRFGVTHDEKDRHFFRVPTLRNIAKTAPYFHNGSVGALDEAVRVMAKVQLNKTLKDEEVADIVAFLKTLTGEFPTMTMPRLPGIDGGTVIDDLPTNQKGV